MTCSLPSLNSTAALDPKKRRTPHPLRRPPRRNAPTPSSPWSPLRVSDDDVLDPEIERDVTRGLVDLRTFERQRTLPTSPALSRQPRSPPAAPRVRARVCGGSSA